MTVLNMVEAIRSALVSEMEHDERTMVLGADVGRCGGVFRATDGLQARFGKDRVVDTPISEAAIVGSAIGLSNAGFVPIVELQFLGFAPQAYHQIASQLGRMRSRSNGKYNAAVTIRAPYGGGVGAPELHSDSFEAVLAHCPGVKVVAPGTASDAKGLLTTSVRDQDPVVFLEPLRGYRRVRDDVPDGEHVVPFGRSRLARDGDDVTLVCWGGLVAMAMEAAEAAARLGVSVAVLDLRTLVPLDVQGLLDAVAATGRAVVVQESALTCGFASEVAATILEEIFDELDAPVRRVSGFDVPIPMPQLEDQYLPSVERILTAIMGDGALLGPRRLLPDGDVLGALAGEGLPLPASPTLAQGHPRQPRHEVQLGGPHVAERHRERLEPSVEHPVVMRDQALSGDVVLVET